MVMFHVKIYYYMSQQCKLEQSHGMAFLKCYCEIHRTEELGGSLFLGYKSGFEEAWWLCMPNLKLPGDFQWTLTVLKRDFQGTSRAFLEPSLGLPRAFLEPSSGLPRAFLGPSSGLPRAFLKPSLGLNFMENLVTICQGVVKQS